MLQDYQVFSQALIKSKIFYFIKNLDLFITSMVTVVFYWYGALFFFCTLARLILLELSIPALLRPDEVNADTHSFRFSGIHGDFKLEWLNT